jgi:hypothetical protein
MRHRQLKRNRDALAGDPGELLVKTALFETRDALTTAMEAYESAVLAEGGRGYR